MTKKSRNAESGRFSSRRKTKAVLRLLRGGDRDLLSREYGVVGSPQGYLGQFFGVIVPQERSLSDDQEE